MVGGDGELRHFAGLGHEAIASALGLTVYQARQKWTNKFPLTLAAANYPLALDAKGGRLFVGCRKKPTVVVLDLQTGKEVEAVEIPGDIDDLFYDAKRDRLYASCGAGVLAVLQSKEGQHYEVAERVPTGKLARTCLFDAESSRLYVPVPRQAGKDDPELRVFQVKL